ncbi:MAG: MBL fold metallo-hydrolase [Dehalococcoidia bacterium]
MIDATPLVLGDNNVWPFRLSSADGGGWLLVDAGIEHGAGAEGDPASWDALVAQARAIGCAPEDVRVVVVTHEHIDHAGLAARWARAGAAIVAMPEALPMLVAGYPAYEAMRARRMRELRRHGCPPDVLEVLAARVRDRRVPTLDWTPCPREALVAAQDGDTFALENGRTLHLIAAPGHTPGNLVAFVAREGATAGELCSGDTLLPHTIPTPGLQFPAIAIEFAAETGKQPATDAPRWPSLPPFLRSVDRLRALEVRRILPGHGAVVEDPARLFAQFTEHHARRIGRVAALLTRAETAGVTSYEVARGLFPRLPAARIGQALTEIIGHLDVLQERGEALQAADADGVVRTRSRTEQGRAG